MDAGFLTAHEVARLLRTSVDTVRDWAEMGKLPAYRMDGSNRLLFRQADIKDRIRLVGATTEPVESNA